MFRVFILRSDTQAQSLWSFLRANWRAMAEADKPLSVTIAEYETKRSVEQNARYWGHVLKQIEAKAWVDGKQYSAEIWHEHIKRKILGCVELPNGETMGQSTAGLGVGKFADFMTKVEAYAATELGVEFTA